MNISRVLLPLFVMAALTACSAGGSNPLDGDGGAAGSGATGAGGTGTGAQGGGIGGFNTGGAGGMQLIDEVFGHSGSVLYRLDPQTKEVNAVGPFQGCDGSIIDIAIDKNNDIYGTTFTGLFRIDSTNAQCTLVASGSYPNSLSFVPEGTIDPNEEAMVGYLDADYVRINKTTGQVTTIGGITGGYISSGDIVSVIDGGTYLTVKDNGCDDCLFEVNPVTGDMVKNWGAVGHSQVFGLAYWGGKAYGFTNAGDLFEITFDQNSVSTVLIPIPGAPADLSFYGAGSSTAVPVDPPE